MPHVRPPSRLRQRQCEQQRRHDHCNRHGTSQPAPDPSDRHDRHQNQGPDLNCVNHVAPSFPESPTENYHAEYIRSAEARIAQLIEPGPDSIGPKPVRARRKCSECQRPNPGRQTPGMFADEARRDCFVVLGQCARKHGRFPFERVKQLAARCALFNMRSEFPRARWVELSLEIEQARHFIKMDHAAPPAARLAPPCPSRISRNWWRARNSTTPTNVRRTPSVAAMSS